MDRSITESSFHVNSIFVSLFNHIFDKFPVFPAYYHSIQTTQHRTINAIKMQLLAPVQCRLVSFAAAQQKENSNNSNQPGLFLITMIVNIYFHNYPQSICYPPDHYRIWHGLSAKVYDWQKSVALNSSRLRRADLYPLK